MDYFDLHCDTPYECYAKGLDFNDDSLAVSSGKAADFERWSQCFAVWIREELPEPYHFYCNVLSNFRRQLSQKPDNLTPLLTVEGGSVLEDRIERLTTLSDDGIRAMTLTWNGENRIAGGAKSNATLTHYGKSVIRRMNEVKIACDLSHLNRKSFFQSVELAEHPLATHSNCTAVCEHPRNLTDEQIRLIAERHGVIGLCFYPPFLGGDVYQKLYENIFHLLDLGLENCISVGSDFDGGDMSPKLDGIDKIPLLYAFLSEKGLPDDILSKIFYENAEKFFACL